MIDETRAGDGGEVLLDEKPLWAGTIGCTSNCATESEPERTRGASLGWASTVDRRGGRGLRMFKYGPYCVDVDANYREYHRREGRSGD
jgi:hypothetical protein